MAKSNNDVPKIICVNITQENEKRLLEARIRSQEKNQTKQDLNKLFHKLNQIKVKENLPKSTEKLSLSCYNRNVTNCWYGPVPGFPSGSWWGIRMDCSRDRVHDPFDADIAEGPFGVTSICTSHINMNEDVDFGDFLTLTGQIYHKDQPNADPVICNYKDQTPLRLIRSYNLQNKIAPNTGYRYDGLYIVIGHWIGTNAKEIKYNKFALMRLANQEPPSWKNQGSDALSSVQYNISARSNHTKLYGSNNVYDLRRCLYNADGICGKRKYSHRDSHENSSATKTTLVSMDTKKSVSESSIVTRHVFKKPSNTESTIGSTSVPDRKTLTCLGISAPKTHSTNISIRMGLYESSHSAQEAKKNISIMLHKPFKPIDIANRTALDIERVCVPPKEDNLITRIDTDKTQANLQPIEDILSCHATNNNTANEPTCPLSKHRKNLCSHPICPSEHSHDVSSSLNNPHNGTNTECKEYLRNVQHSTNVSVQKLNSVTESQKNAVATHERNSKCDDTPEASCESLCAQNIKSLKSFDSLTPDKILNLINKEKHHPLSKLLIGNVIGLTTEECAMWNTSKVAAEDTSPKMNHKQRNDAKENVACLSEDILNRRYCKYSKSIRLPRRVSRQADAGKFDKMLPRQSCNDTDQNCVGNARMKDQNDVSKKSNECLSPFHIQAPLQTITQRSHNTYEIKTRLRADKGVVLAKQKFSNSPIKKSRYKKQDREIANLSIDAKFGPKTRGPRNRRLRCINNIYANKRYYNTFNAVIYPPGKRNMITEKQRYKSNFKRKSKLTKASRARNRQSKDGYRVSNTLRTKSNSKDIKNTIEKGKDFERITKNNNSSDRNYNNNNERKKENETVVTDTTSNVSSFDGSLRKKLAQTVSLPRRASQSSRLHYFPKKQVEKPSMMDATTQCRLIFEEPIEKVLRKVRSENLESALLAASSADHEAEMMTTWDNSNKKTTESAHGVTCNEDSHIDETYTRAQNAKFYPASACTEGEYYADSPESLRRLSSEEPLQSRASAFVPVNAFDSDLRIARLRSIGFKPIKPRSPPTADEQKEHTFVNTSKVMKRDVAEEYDKYTDNEDNNVVVYMDDELQYQDIEEEEDENILARERMTSTKASLRSMIKENENSESPWHGWKKVVTNNRSYWIGW